MNTAAEVAAIKNLDRLWMRYLKSRDRGDYEAYLRAKRRFDRQWLGGGVRREAA